MMATVRLGPEILFALEMKGQVPHRRRAQAFECAGLMIRFECTFN